MKLTKNCKEVLDSVKSLAPNNGIRFYTIDYVLKQKPELNLPRADLIGILETLSEAHAITWGDQQHTGFALTELGKEYKQLNRLERIDRWKERAFGFLSGVAVTVIGALIIQWFLG